MKEEEKRLSRDEEYRIDQRIRIGVILGAVVILLYLVYMGVAKKPVGVFFQIIVLAFVAAYWLVSDVLAMKWKHGFAERTQEQKTAYYKAAALDLVGACGLGYFLAGMNQNNSMIGALLYLAGTLGGRKFRQEYEKNPEETEKKADKEEDRRKAIDELPTAADRAERTKSASERVAELNELAQSAESKSGDEEA